MEDLKDNGINLGQIQSMLAEIETMTVEEHQHIFFILNNNGVKYTENDNGIFARVNQLPLGVIHDIYNYVLDVRETRTKMETAIRSIETQNIENDPENAQVEDNPGKSSILIDEWKKEIIEKMRTETRGRTKKRKAVKSSPII